VTLGAWLVGGLVACDAAPSRTEPSSTTAPSATVASATATAGASSRKTLKPATTPIPDEATWAQAKVVNLRGGPRVGCQGKVAGEYFRLVCKSGGEAGAAPKDVMLLGEHQKSREAGAMAIVVPYVRGTKATALTVVWEGAVHTMALYPWRPGQPPPKKVGQFVLDAAPNSTLLPGPDGACPAKTVKSGDVCLRLCSGEGDCPSGYSCEEDDTGAFPMTCLPISQTVR
jgi:hypothetical protein